MRWIAVSALVIGCDGSNGKSQPVQTQDGDTPTTPNPPGSPASSGLVWVDANGDEVPGVFLVDQDQVDYLDEAGVVWSLDPWATTAGAAFRPTGSPEVVYSDADCTEAWLFGRLLAGWAVSFELHDEAEPSTWALPPDAARGRLDTYYSFSGSDCVDATVGGGDDAFEAASLVPAALPELTWTPPLHSEWR